MGSRKEGETTDLCSEARQMPAAWTEGLFDNHSKEEQIRAQQMSSQKNQKCFQQPSSISRSCGGWIFLWLSWELKRGWAEPQEGSGARTVEATRENSPHGPSI